MTLAARDMVLRDPRRLPEPWKCPETGCEFESTWTPAILNHKEKEARLRGQATRKPRAKPAPHREPRTHQVQEALLPEGCEKDFVRAPPPGPPSRRDAAAALTLDRVEKIAELVAERVVTNRQHRLMRGFGMVPLTGRIEFIREGATWRARIDGHDLVDLLRLTFAEGNRVSALFADAMVLEGDAPQPTPPTGTRADIYRPGNQLNDPRRMKGDAR